MKKTLMLGGIIGVVLGASMVYAGSLNVTDNLAPTKAKNTPTGSVTILVDGKTIGKVLKTQSGNFSVSPGPTVSQIVAINYDGTKKDISSYYQPYAGKQHSFITMYQHSDTKLDTHCHGADGTAGGDCVQNLFPKIDVLLGGY